MFVLGRYLASGGYLSVVVRPLAGLLALAVLMQLALWLVTRSRDVSAFAAAVVLALLLDPMVALLIVVAGGAVLGFDTFRERRVQPLDWRRLTRVLNAIALATVVVTGAMIGLSGNVPAAQFGSAPGVATPDAPDVYVILLDGYPRTDTLANVFGFDDGPFVTALDRLGFDESTNSHSNYNATSLTLASMFNARQVPELLADRRVGTMVTSEVLQRRTNGGAALTWLREAGYRLISIPSGVTSANLAAVDQVIDSGQINSFEVSLLRQGLLPRLPLRDQAAWIYDQQRDRIQATFETLKAIAASRDARARFVFAHVMSPHAPILFDADGRPVSPPACFPSRCGPWDATPDSAGMVDQIRYLNTLVVDAVAGIISASSRAPVIVIMSDHGSRLVDRDEMLRNLFIARTPGHPGLFPEDVTPINLVPRLLNAYTDAAIPLATRESYEVDLSAVPTRGYLPLLAYPQS